jgi:hypothetical protein
MQKRALMFGILALITIAISVNIVMAAQGPEIGASPEIVVRDGDGTTDYFRIYYFSARPSAVYDLYINDGDVSGITPPTISTIGNEVDNIPAVMGPGHWQFWTTRPGDRGKGIIVFWTSTATTPGTYVFKVTDPSGTNPDLSTTVVILANATPTPTPTPDPNSTVTTTETTITPEPTETVDLAATIALIETNISAQEQINAEQQVTLEAHETAIGDINATIATQATIMAEHVAITTSPTVNYSATIAAIQTQQAAQAEQIDWLTSAINTIKSLLGLV